MGVESYIVMRRPESLTGVGVESSTMNAVTGTFRGIALIALLLELREEVKSPMGREG
jgi:hypothetical protein